MSFEILQPHFFFENFPKIRKEKLQEKKTIFEFDKKGMFFIPKP